MSKKRKHEAAAAALSKDASLSASKAFNPGPKYTKSDMEVDDFIAKSLAASGKEIWLMQLPKKMPLNQMQGLRISMTDGDQPAKEGSLDMGIQEIATFHDNEGSKFVVEGESAAFSNQLCVVIPGGGGDDGGSLILPVAKRVTVQRAINQDSSHHDAEQAGSLSHDDELAAPSTPGQPDNPKEKKDKSGKKEKRSEKKDKDKSAKKEKKEKKKDKSKD